MTRVGGIERSENVTSEKALPHSAVYDEYQVFVLRRRRIKCERDRVDNFTTLRFSSLIGDKYDPPQWRDDESGCRPAPRAVWTVIRPGNETVLRLSHLPDAPFSGRRNDLGASTADAV